MCMCAFVNERRLGVTLDILFKKRTKRSKLRQMQIAGRLSPYGDQAHIVFYWKEEYFCTFLVLRYMFWYGNPQTTTCRFKGFIFSDLFNNNCFLLENNFCDPGTKNRGLLRNIFFSDNRTNVNSSRIFFQCPSGQILKEYSFSDPRTKNRVFKRYIFQ